MRKTDEDGRCVECGLYPRPDIARVKKEKHCRDPEMNKMHDWFRGFLKQNQKNIDKLVDKLGVK